MKNVLLISPTISDMYKDIISQLEAMGMVVDFIEDKGDLFDPDFIRVSTSKLVNNPLGRYLYNRKCSRRWISLLKQPHFSKKYDYLLVIDGMSVCNYLFQELKKRNPEIWMANYLFDSTRSLYRFQRHFDHYNIVASFDKIDCEKYNLVFLPIYWISDEQRTNIYDIFALGGYGKSRFELYSNFLQIAKGNNLSYYIKLYYPAVDNYKLYEFKEKIKKIIGRTSGIPIPHYNSELITHQSLSAPEFREKLLSSRVIIDNVNFDQDGMTARFMWALGAQKKIITTNRNIVNYTCYTPDQIFVLDNNSSKDDLVKFIRSEHQIPKNQIDAIYPWRLDNWLSLLLNLKIG